jgi:hypothetical protein
MKLLSYIQLQEKYGGKFIAKSNGEVAAFASTYKSLIVKITKKHLNRINLTFAYIHPKGAICVYSISSKRR